MVAGSPDTETPVRTKVLLVDPETMAVRWTNAIAGAPTPGDEGEPHPPVELTQVVPMSEALGLPDVVRQVGRSGVAQHLSANLVTTGKGSIAYVVSVHRLPDGAVLVLAEHSWHVGEGGKPPREPRGSKRRR